MFKRGLSARAAVHAARFLLPYVDPQGVNQSYTWTTGSPLRLLLLDALALLDGEDCKRNDLKCGERNAFTWLTDACRHGAVRAAVAEAIQEAICAVLSWDNARSLIERDPTRELSEVKNSAKYRSLRYDRDGGCDNVEYPWEVWSAKAMHRAYRILGDDGRSLLGYVKACLEGEADNQSQFDHSVRSEWKQLQEEGVTLRDLYRELGK